MSAVRKKKLGTISARLTELAYPEYRIDFTSYVNLYDSDDEGNDCQWSCPIRFTYLNQTFLNKDEVEYDTRERHTCKVFWAKESTTISKMVATTLMVRKARGESLPAWPLSVMCRAADDAWDKFKGV